MGTMCGVEEYNMKPLSPSSPAGIRNYLRPVVKAPTEKITALEIGRYQTPAILTPRDNPKMFLKHF